MLGKMEFRRAPYIANCELTANAGAPQVMCKLLDDGNLLLECGCAQLMDARECYVITL